jgi:hypothetical protein
LIDFLAEICASIDTTIPDIAGVMTEQQRQTFFSPAYDWLVQVNGQLTKVWTSRDA